MTEDEQRAEPSLREPRPTDARGSVERSPLAVSVVIPAHNASATISRTLDSLRAQSIKIWEAIVVDDGSRDETSAIVDRYAHLDPRIRIERRPHEGVSAARDAGIRLARHGWLLFLDSDDWLRPTMLERMAGTLAANAQLDGVHCGWIRYTPEGAPILPEESYDEGEAFFHRSARRCPFMINSFLVRRDLVESMGGFDVDYELCEDWVLWQRIARAGARIGRVDEALACVMMRAGSASSDSRRLLAAGLRLIDLGHGPDPRVPRHHADYAARSDPTRRAACKFNLLCWSAGQVLGRGEDARDMLRLVEAELGPDLDPRIAAEALFESAPLATLRTCSEWPAIWPAVEHRVEEFLTELEALSGATALAARVRSKLLHLITEKSRITTPLTLGTFYFITIEATSPIFDVALPASTDRLICFVELEGTSLGKVELPVCDGSITGDTLADAIAAEFAWPILGRYFKHFAQKDRSFASRIDPDDVGYDPEVHDRIGWGLFLNEIWGHPAGSGARFYGSTPGDANVFDWRSPIGRWLEFEVAEEIPGIATSEPEIDVVVRVGGVAIAKETILIPGGRLLPGELLAEIDARCGFELCRAAVREGLLGRPISIPTSLRDRLLEAAASAKQCKASAYPKVPEGVELGPGTLHDLARIPTGGGITVVIGRRIVGPMGTSVSRRSTLPIAAAAEIARSEATAGLVLQVPEADDSPRRIIYSPDLIWRNVQQDRNTAAGPAGDRANPEVVADNYGRAYFEAAFAERKDPWKYTSEYERVKYEQALAMLPETRIERALELACAEGHFTERLAPGVGALIAADISQIALERAARRCDGSSAVTFQRLDLTKDRLPGSFDLIVCSEVLYYVGERGNLRTIARKFADALRPDGHLLMAHANLVVDDPDQPGYAWDLPFGAKVIGETFAELCSLRFVKELRAPLYRIQLFRRMSECPSEQTGSPKIVEVTDCTPPPAEFSRHICWQGRSSPVEPANRTVSTSRLPILKYHRIARTGPPSLSRYRVTPEAFEEQLGFLRDTGYSSIGLDDWRFAMALLQPLPGRAIVITFDDGYADFLDDAWSILKRFNYSAIVFLVADRVGDSNRWDNVLGSRIPLLGWDDVRWLHREGVEFGSHSATHPYLTALPLADVVREAINSRSMLEERLVVPVRSFAYPYGDVDQAIQKLIGGCGYTFGLSSGGGPASLHESLLALPRIEVTGSDGLSDFVRKITSS